MNRLYFLTLIEEKKSADPEVRGVTRRVVSLWYLDLLVYMPPPPVTIFEEKSPPDGPVAGSPGKSREVPGSPGKSREL